MSASHLCAIIRALLVGVLVASLSGSLSVLAMAPPSGAKQAPRPAQGNRPELIVQLGHSDEVTSVSLSADGKWLATGSQDSTARLWEVATGKEVRAFRGHQSWVTSVALSGDGKLLITGGGDKTARLWEVATGRELQVFRGHSKEVTSVSLSPDKRWLATGGRDNTARLWQLDTGKEVAVFRGHAKAVTSVALSGGRWLATGSEDNSARLWELASAKEVRVFRGPASLVTAVALSRDGRWLVTGSDDNTARLWNTASGKLTREFRGRYEYEKDELVRSFVKYMAAVTRQSLERTYGPLPRFRGALVTSLSLSADGRWLATGSWDLTARLWDTATGKEVHTFKGPLTFVNAVSLSADGRWLGTCNFGNTAPRLWEVASGSEFRNFAGHALAVRFLSLSGDGEWLVAGTADYGPGFGTPASVLAEGVRLADDKNKRGGPESSTGHLWSADTGKEVRAFPDVSSLFLSHDGKRLATGGLKAARIWDTSTGREIQVFRGHSGIVSSLFLAADGKLLVTGSTSDDDNKSARLWDVATGNELQTFPGRSVDWVCLAKNGSRLLTRSLDKNLHVWNTATGKEVGTLKEPPYPEASFIAMTCDSKWLLLGFRDGTARMRKLGAGKVARDFRGHSHAVISMRLSADGERLATGSEDNTVRLWDVATGHELCTLVFSSGGILVITPDGYYMGPKSALGAVSWRVGGRSFPFEQFDLKYNRPDKVLERLGSAPRGLMGAYRQAYQKRLRKMGFREENLGSEIHLPEVVLPTDLPLTTKQRSLVVKVRAGDSKFLLNRLFVQVNGVPVGRSGGIDLRGKKTRDWQQEVPVELSSGPNVISVSALNEKGAESLARTAVVTYTPKEPQKPNLYVVAVGVSHYADKRFNLDYADKDAKDISAYLSSRAGKSFGKAQVLRLLDKEATREKILGSRKLLEKAGVDDQVVLFFAGHGLLDGNLDYYFATPDIDFKNPAGKGLPYREIEGLLDGLWARRKLLLIDSCHAGEADKEELGPAKPRKFPEGTVRARSFRGLEFARQEQPSARLARQLSEELFYDLRRGTGTVVIASAGDVECALESDAWNNGVFTYAVLHGLKDRRADRDKNGQVTSLELWNFVRAEVQRLTQGRQAPTFRAENLFDFPVD